MAFIKDKNGRIVSSISTRQSAAGAVAAAHALGISPRSGSSTFSKYQPPNSEATLVQESAVQRAARRARQAVRKIKLAGPGERRTWGQEQHNVRAYIIAHVAFDNSGKTYPVNCFRTDVRIGHQVVVKMNKGPLKWAQVVDTNYLNWSCQNSVVCLANEAQFTVDGIILPPGDSLTIKGLTRPSELATRLFKLGWVPRRAASKMYRMAYSAENRTQTALILMRKNGIDVQIIDGRHPKVIKPNSVLSIRRTDGPFFAQTLHGSLNNVFERTAAFGAAFLLDTPQAEELIIPQQTSKVLPSPPSRIPSENEVFY